MGWGRGKCGEVSKGGTRFAGARGNSTRTVGLRTRSRANRSRPRPRRRPPDGKEGSSVATGRPIARGPWQSPGFSLALDAACFSWNSKHEVIEPLLRSLLFPPPPLARPSAISYQNSSVMFSRRPWLTCTSPARADLSGTASPCPRPGTIPVRPGGSPDPPQHLSSTYRSSSAGSTCTNRRRCGSRDDVSPYIYGGSRIKIVDLCSFSNTFQFR